MKSPLKHLSSHKFSSMRSPTKEIQQTNIEQAEVIDEHLLVQALALCSLVGQDDIDYEEEVDHLMYGLDEDEVYAENVNLFQKKESQTPPTMGKVLDIIERIANSDGMIKQTSKSGNRTTKYVLGENKGVLNQIRKKYSAYFAEKYNISSKEKKNFQDIMDMSSIWSNTS